MRINYLGYYHDYDGYGRFNSRMVKALRKAGVTVNWLSRDDVFLPDWMLKEREIDWSNLTISCMPGISAEKVPGRHWYITMLESNIMDHEWLTRLCSKDIERLFVPCQENRITFENAGVNIPIDIFRGGTDPEEFPVLPRKTESRPYTFLALTDRGTRKGWCETWEAFYKAFGGKTTGEMDVRLILKYLPSASMAPTMEAMQSAVGADKRIVYLKETAKWMKDVYAQADCVVLPSYFEGWGMPHREAAMMGLPVITQDYSGMDDGFTDKWALVVEGEMLELGWWKIPKVDSIAERMRWCFDNPEAARDFGLSASSWLKKNQTWDHAAANLIDEITRDSYVRDRHCLQSFA